MDLLSREEILGAADRVVEDVPIPEWGGKAIRLAPMSGARREAYERLVRQQKDGGAGEGQMRASLVAASAVDAEGKPLFELADVPALAEKNWVALDRASLVAMRMNRLNVTPEAAAKN